MLRCRNRLLTALLTGGSCVIFPLNSSAAFLISSSGTSPCRCMRQMYSLPALRRLRMMRVALPVATGSTPVTAGSRLPPCPALRMWRMSLMYATVKWLVGPLGLLRLMTPYWSSVSAGLLFGSSPRDGSVSASVFVSIVRCSCQGSMGYGSLGGLKMF